MKASAPKRPLCAPYGLGRPVSDGIKYIQVRTRQLPNEPSNAQFTPHAKLRRHHSSKLGTKHTVVTSVCSARTNNKQPVFVTPGVSLIESIISKARATKPRPKKQNTPDGIVALPTYYFYCSSFIVIVRSYLETSHATVAGSAPIATENNHHRKRGKTPTALASTLAAPTGVRHATALMGRNTPEMELPMRPRRVAKELPFS